MGFAVSCQLQFSSTSVNSAEKLRRFGALTRAKSDKNFYEGIFSNFFRAESKLSQVWPRAV
jgi:hypothetical protein